MRTSGIIVGLLLAFVVGGLISYPELSARGLAGPLVAQEQDPAEPAEAPDPEAERKKAAERTAKMASLTRRLHIAELKLQQTRLENDSSLTSANEAVQSAAEEFQIAEGELTQFREFDSVQRREQAAMSLQSSRDRAEEAAAELQQIELMYEDQDLDDRTAEFVIQRGRRNAERAQQRIALEEMAMQALTQHELPRELQKRTLAVQQKQVALESARRARELAKLKVQVSLASAESEIAGIREELELLRSEK